MSDLAMALAESDALPKETGSDDEEIDTWAKPDVFELTQVRNPSLTITPSAAARAAATLAAAEAATAAAAAAAAAIVDLSTELTKPEARRDEVRFARLDTPLGHIPLCLPAVTVSSLGALTQRENRRLASRVHFCLAPSADSTPSGARITQVLEEWTVNQMARVKTFNTLVQSIASIVEVSQARAHYVGTTIQDDVLYREVCEEGQSMYFKVYADLCSGPSHLKVEVRGCSVESHAGVWVSTEQNYPSARNSIWNAPDHNSSSNKTIIIGDRDVHAICGWYYIAVDASSTTAFTIRVTVHANEQKNRQRTGGDGASNSSSNKNVHERLRAKIDEIAQSPDAKLALRNRIIAFRRKQELKKSGGIGRHVRNIVSDNAADAMIALYTPRGRDEARAQWAANHANRIETVLQTALKVEEDMAVHQDKVQLEFERRFLESDRRRNDLLRKRGLSQLQRKWIIWMVIGVRQQHWKAQLQSGRVLREVFIRKSNAINTIRAFILKAVQKRRYKRARRSLLSLRTLIRVCAVNHQIIIKHRSIDVIKQVLESAAGVQKNLSTIIKNFRAKVVTLQQFHARWRLMREAKLKVWVVQWDALESRTRDDAVPELIRIQLLKELLLKLRRETVKAKEQYEIDLKDYQKKKKIEDAKRLISDEAEVNPMKAPRRPLIPVILPKKLLYSLINEGRKRAHDPETGGDK